MDHWLRVLIEQVQGPEFSSSAPTPSHWNMVTSRPPIRVAYSRFTEKLYLIGLDEKTMEADTQVLWPPCTKPVLIDHIQHVRTSHTTHA